VAEAAGFSNQSAQKGRLPHPSDGVLALDDLKPLLQSVDAERGEPATAADYRSLFEDVRRFSFHRLS
jgi:hypothetical protein